MFRVRFIVKFARLVVVILNVCAIGSSVERIETVQRYPVADGSRKGVEHESSCGGSNVPKSGGGTFQRDKLVC